jgi:hypothetical protein
MDGKKLFFVTLLLGCFFTVGSIYALPCDAVRGNPPINECELSSGGQMIVNYNFGPQMKSLFCASSIIHSGIITWPSKGGVLSASMPALLSRVTDDKKLFIDGVGQFQITNNTTKPLIIFCEFSA